MTFLTILQLIVNIIIVGLLIFALIAIIGFLIFDRKQKQHSVLRNYPVLARVRYFLESIGPELRQYLFLNDNEDQPFSRSQYQHIVLAGKYNDRKTSFGSELNYDEGFFLNNAMFPTQLSELALDNKHLISTFVYDIQRESLFSRKERIQASDIEPYFLHPSHYISLERI